MADAEILINFAPKGDEEVLTAIKKVSKHVGDLKRIAKTPIDLEIVKKAMRPEDFNRLKATIDNAKNATRDFAKEAAKAARDQERLAAVAERAAQRKAAAEERAWQRFTIAAEKAAARQETIAARLAAKVEREAARKAAAEERAAERAAKAAERAAERAAAATARAARMSPVMGGITGSMAGGGGKGPLLPLGAGPMNAPLDPRQFSKKAIDDLNKSLGLTDKNARRAGEGLGFVGRIIAAMAIRSAVHEIYQMANAYTAFQNKIKTVLKDQQDLNFVSNELIGIAQRSRQSLEAVGTIYTRTSRAVELLGKSQYETMRFTETLSKAVAVGGSTSIEAKNAMIQLSQGMSSGTLKGDELRSVLEQLPIVAELIAKKMGVTVGQLRKLGSEGKLTTDVVFSAITDATKDIDAAFAKMKPTMEQIVDVIKDKFMVAIGESSVLMDFATKSLQLLSDNFDMAFKAAEAFSVILLSLGAANVFKMIAGFAATLGPVGLVVAGLAAAGSALYVFGDSIQVNAEKTKTLNNVLGDLWGSIKRGTVSAVEGMEETAKLMGDGFEIMGKAAVDFGNKISNSAVALDDFQGKLHLRHADQFKNDLKDITKEAKEQKTALQELNETHDKLPWRKLTKESLPKGAAGKHDFTALVPKTPQYTPEELERERAAYQAYLEDQRNKNRKFNDFIKSQMPKDLNEMINLDPVKDKKAGKESGKTLEEVIREATIQEGISRLGDLEEKIQKRLHTLVESLKPSVKAAIEDIGGAKAIEAEKKRLDKLYGQNYDKFTSSSSVEQTVDKKMRERIALVKAEGDALRDKAKRLEEIVRLEITREYEQKKYLELRKAIKKAAEEDEKVIKKREEHNKSMLEEAADRQIASSDKFKGIATGLSPELAIRGQIQELEAFRSFAKKNEMADWARLATEEIESLHRELMFGLDPIKEYHAQMQAIFGPGGVLVKGFADAAANAIVMSSSLGDLRRALVDVLTSVQTQAISSLIQLPMNIAMGALTQSIVGSPTTFDAGGGARSVSASEAASWGFASGGYTGNMGVNEIAGVVHGQEFVLNADATRRMGRQNLEMINKGATPVSGTAAPVQVIVNNNAGVQVETNQLSPGQVEVMITKAIQSQTGRVIAGQINDPNSLVSRSMQKNISSDRRRV